MSKYISVTETAKLVRKALKEHFPKTVFSVRSNSYSGGASIDVKWTDGETETEVDEILKRFAGSTFDGMIDLRSYVDADLNGEQVHFGADHVFSRREWSAPFILKVAEATCAYFQQPVPVLNKWNWFDRTEEKVFQSMTLEEVIFQVLAVTNADDLTVHGRNGWTPEWITDLWARFLHPELTPLIDAAPAPDAPVIEEHPDYEDGMGVLCEPAPSEETPDYSNMGQDAAEAWANPSVYEDDAEDLEWQKVAPREGEGGYEWGIEAAWDMALWEQVERNLKAGVRRAPAPEDLTDPETSLGDSFPDPLPCDDIAQVEDNERRLRQNAAQADILDIIRRRLASVDLDNLTPLQALILLQELKGWL